MKYRFILATPIAILFISSCADNNTDLVENTQEPNLRTGVAQQSSESGTLQPVFHKNIGSFINADTGKSWAANFQSAFPAKEQKYIISAAALKTILSDTTAVGISFCYGKDKEEKQQLLPVGVTSFGYFIVSDKVPVGDGTMTWEEVKQCMMRWTDVPRSHFFGSNKLNLLLSSENIYDVCIRYGINTNNNQVLLLSDNDVVNPIGYLEEAFICPPGCGREN